MTFPVDTACLLDNFPDGSPIAIRPDGAVSVNRFIHDSRQTASTLPCADYVINLCEDRYAFMTGFAGAMIRGQVTLMPHTNAPDTLARIARGYKRVYCLTDEVKPRIDIAAHFVKTDGAGSAPIADAPKFPLSQPAVIAFTSGSSGHPTSHEKSWGSLVKGAILAARRFNICGQSGYQGVATAPQQHMYGFETSIMTPLYSRGAFYTKRAFFPEDLRKALDCLAPPRVLVTTPAHLRAITQACVAMPELSFIISATAPLSRRLALQTEDILKTRVYEIFGFTEAGSIASRRTAETDIWKTYDGVTLRKIGDKFEAAGGHIDFPVAPPDRLELKSETDFLLLGREGDMINIVGKRASLSDLTIKLNEIDGVTDGVFFAPEDNGYVKRLMAFVAAPTVSEKDVLDRLAKVIDRVFLPRPLVFVDKLPRNQTGKITKARLLEMANAQNSETDG